MKRFHVNVSVEGIAENVECCVPPAATAKKIEPCCGPVVTPAAEACCAT
jgi:hypothetical protein